jgi:hypothetical protein
MTIPGMQAAEPISKDRNGKVDKEVTDSTHVYGH